MNQNVPRNKGNNNKNGMGWKYATYSTLNSQRIEMTKSAAK